MWGFDTATGRELWRRSHPAPPSNQYFAGGATGAPTVDGGQVFHRRVRRTET